MEQPVCQKYGHFNERGYDESSTSAINTASSEYDSYSMTNQNGNGKQAMRATPNKFDDNLERSNYSDVISNTEHINATGRGAFNFGTRNKDYEEPNISKECDQQAEIYSLTKGLIRNVEDGNIFTKAEVTFCIHQN